MCLLALSGNCESIGVALPAQQILCGMVDLRKEAGVSAECRDRARTLVTVYALSHSHGRDVAELLYANHLDVLPAALVPRPVLEPPDHPWCGTGRAEWFAIHGRGDLD